MPCQKVWPKTATTVTNELLVCNIWISKVMGVGTAFYRSFRSYTSPKRCYGSNKYVWVYAAMITGYTLKSLVYSLSHPSILYSIWCMERIKCSILCFSPNLAKTEFVFKTTSNKFLCFWARITLNDRFLTNLMCPGDQVDAPYLIYNRQIDKHTQKGKCLTFLG